MKKKIIIACSFLVLLAGCSNAKTQVENDDKVLIKIGGSEIKTGDIYNTLKAQDDISPINEKMSRILIDKVVPVTPELEAAAKTTLEGYKTQYGEEWMTKLKEAGYDDETTFMNEVILINERAKGLTEAFVKADFKNLSEKYKPRTVEIVEIKDSENTTKALDEAKKGTALSEIATKYGETTTYDGTAKVYNSRSGLPDVVWSNITEATKDGSVTKNVLQDTVGQSFFIVKVTKVNPDKFKDEAVTSLKSMTIGENNNNQSVTGSQATTSELSLDDQAFAYFLQKYDYSIHDVDIYKALITSSTKYER